MGEGDLEAGVHVGRYVVLERVGAGATGVVYAAYDPQLDRKVALKLLRAQPGSEPKTAAERLLREAQALAKLSHPNVVTVHDVGTFRGRVFLAMEFIPGATLRAWLAGGRRSVAEVLRVLREAGRGLAAAHAAGLVHRDFKPENVLLAPNERVLVVDFGLARAHAEPAGAGDGRAITLTDLAGSDPSSEASDALLASRIEASVGAASSAFAGTPAYMAPEQFLGDVVGPAADQFSLAICLHEALFGARPFVPARSDLPEVLALGLEVVHGRVRAPARGHPVPSAVQRALQRALNVDPAERFPTIEQFLDAIAPAPVRQRAVAGAIVAVGVAAAVALTVRGPGPCQEDAAELASAQWPRRAPEVRAAFAASGVSAWEDRYARVSASLDRHLAAWSAMKKSACEATRVRGEQSEALLDLRMSCLHRSRQDLAELTAVLTRADAALVNSAPAATLKLSVERCADLEALQNPLARPSDPKLRAALEELEHELAELNALYTAARYQEAVPRARTATQTATRLGYAPLEAEAKQVLASLLEGTGAGSEIVRRLTLEAALLAREGRAETVEATAWINLLWIEATLLQRPEPAAVFRDLAQVAVRRLHDNELDSRLANYSGIAARYQGDYAQAVAHLERAVELSERLGSTRPIVMSSALSNLALAYGKQGRHRQAVECLQRAIQLREAALGRDHPDVALIHNNLVTTLVAFGQYAEALAEAKLSYEMLSRAHGPNHPRALLALNNVGGALMAAGRFAEAEPYVTQALEGRRVALGEGHPDVARSRCDLGEIRLARGDARGALVELDEALRIWSAALGPEHVQVAAALTAKGRAELELGRVSAAAGLLERALDLQVRNGVDAGDVASTKLALVQALRAAGQQEARQRALLDGALVQLVALGPGKAEELAKAQRLSQEQADQRSRKSSRDSFSKSSQR